MPNTKDDNQLPSTATDIPDERGEGNRAADRRYREATERYAHSGAVEPAAQEARRAVDDPTEGAELAEAERIGRSHRADSPAKK